MDRQPQPERTSDDLSASTEYELVWRLVRGDETLTVQAVRGPDSTDYVFQVEVSDGTVQVTQDSKSFTDEAEGQAYLHAEMTRLVSEGWRRDRPELAAE